MSYVAGTYNMSFAGDMYDMPEFPSEFSFHLRDTPTRSFWNNAKKHLLDFISKKKPIAIGLQEMNKDLGAKKVEKDLPEHYKMITEEIVLSFGKPAVSIIYNTEIAGKEVKRICIDNVNQKGRPLLMLITKKGDETFLFASMHGAQTPKNGQYEEEFNNDMKKMNKDFLQEEATKFLDETPKHIFIMGDFNDRYDAIKNLTIKELDVKYDGDSPKSCCHNWDSMGNITTRKNIQKQKLDGPTLEAASKNSSDKFQGVKPSEEDPSKNDKVIISPEYGITIKDYLNKGDKVFSNHGGTLEMYSSTHSEKDGISQASDHELVFMTTAAKAKTAAEKVAEAQKDAAETSVVTGGSAKKQEATTEEATTEEATTVEPTTVEPLRLPRYGTKGHIEMYEQEVPAPGVPAPGVPGGKKGKKSRKGRQSKKGKKGNRKTKKARKTKKGKKGRR